MEVWKNEKSDGNTSRRRVFPQLSFLSKGGPAVVEFFAIKSEEGTRQSKKLYRVSSVNARKANSYITCNICHNINFNEP